MNETHEGSLPTLVLPNLRNLEEAGDIEASLNVEVIYL